MSDINLPGALPIETRDFICKLLIKNPDERMSAETALEDIIFITKHMTKTWLMSAQFTNVKADFTPFFVKLTSTNNDFDVIYSTIASLPTTSNSNLPYI